MWRELKRLLILDGTVLIDFVASLSCSLLAIRRVEGRNRWVAKEGQSVDTQLPGAIGQGGLLYQDARQYEILTCDLGLFQFQEWF